MLASRSSATEDAARQSVSTWIRSPGVADATMDFAAVRDPSDPTRIDQTDDGGDDVYFNAAGYTASKRAPSNRP